MPPPCKDLEIQLKLSTRVVTNQASLEEVNGYQKLGPTPSGGTLVANPSPSTISIYGNAWNSYRLSSTYTFDIYSRLRLTLVMTDHVIGICFTENLNAMLSNKDIHCFQFPSHQILKSEWG